MLYTTQRCYDTTAELNGFYFGRVSSMTSALRLLVSLTGNVIPREYGYEYSEFVCVRDVVYEMVIPCTTRVTGPLITKRPTANLG